MSEIDDIKARLDIVDVISETINIKRSGKNYVGFCPFHSNTHTPSFYVFVETSTWHCFGCHEGGDIFSFVMKKEGLDFKDTFLRLAERAGIELHPSSTKDLKEEGTNEELRNILNEAIIYYQNQLRNTPLGQKTLEYIYQRGINDNSIESFGLGYASGGWDSFTRQFLSKGYTADDLLKVGMVSKRDSGGVYDRFRNRLMFPIRDERGRIAGFGARALTPDDLPKYLNSPQTPLFDKSHLLYGFDLARKIIRSQNQAIIVEGYMDVIALHQHGFSNVVSPMGTALNEYHLRMLKKQTRRIVLALDADAAGSQATMRGLEIARHALDHQDEPVFDARGLLRYEARLQADIRVASLPQGQDPDEVVTENPDLWKHILQNAKPIVVHVMDVMAAGKNLDNAKEKEEVAQQILPLIQDLPSAIERETYRQHLARLLKVDERALLGKDKANPYKLTRIHPKDAPLERNNLGEDTNGPILVPPLSTSEREAHILSVLLRDPNLLFYIDRILQENNLEKMFSLDFQRSDYREIFITLRQSLEQHEFEPYIYIQNTLSPILLGVADNLYSRTENYSAFNKRVIADLVRALLYLRLDHYRKQKTIIDFQIAESQEQGNEEVFLQLKSQLKEHVKILALYDRAWGRYIQYN